MLTDRIREHVGPEAPISRREAPDPAFDVRPKLRALQETLQRAASDPWLWKANKAPLFYFDTARQVEYEAFRESRNSGVGDHTRARAAWEAIDRGVAEVWPALVADANVRHAARALAGFHAAVAALAPLHPAVRDLNDLLHVLDDEVLCVVQPATRAGFIMEAHAVAEVNQIHDLLEKMQPRARLHDSSIPSDRVRYQIFALSGLQADGTLPTGPGGAGHWLFNEQPASALPSSDGERVVLLGEPLSTVSRSGEARFPDLQAQGRLIRTLTLAEVCDRLTKWLGQPIAEQMAPRVSVSRAA